MGDFLPRRGADLLSWSAAFDRNISLNAPACQLSAAQVADYSAAHVAFAEAFARIGDSATDSSLAIAQKMQAERALRTLARKYAGHIRSVIGINPVLLYALGLSLVRPGGQFGARRARIAPPGHAPWLRVQEPVGRTIIVHLRDCTAPTSRAKPRGVAGASIFTFTGETPPASITQWLLAKNVSRTTTRLHLGSQLAPGAKVWITARWMNPRQEPGPASPPVGLRVGFSSAPDLIAARLKAA